MAEYWIYAVETDEAGCIVDGASPEAASRKAVRLGWLDPRGAEVWAVELGACHSLGRRGVMKASPKE